MQYNSLGSVDEIADSKRYKINEAITATADEMFEHAAQVWDYFLDKIIGGRAARSLGNLGDFRIELNDYFLLAAVSHARTELSRWADYHLVGSKSHPSEYKLAGFFGRWIAKIKPIQITLANGSFELGDNGAEFEIPEMPAILYTINASFAATVIRSYLDCDLVQQDLVRDLIYRLHYRDESALCLSSFAEYMDRTGSNFPDFPNDGEDDGTVEGDISKKVDGK